MPQGDSDATFFAGFADYLQRQRPAIGRQWTKAVRASPEVPRALLITHAELEDHVPELIGDLVERLQRETEAGKASASDHSRSHGREQWKAGYNIAELIWEIYIIRQVVTQTTLSDFLREHPEYSAAQGAGAAALVQDFFHRLTCDSVGQFIQEQQRTLEEKNAELQRAGKARERLTGTVSHELRNVLNALTMTMTLLEDELEAEERGEMLKRCARMLRDMTRILSDLLDYSALIAGRGELRAEPVSLPGLLAEIVTEWKPVATGSGLSFEDRCDPALGQIVSDRLKLKQIAGNLLSNAIKYRKPAHGGHVGISFTAEKTGGWSMVVADTGIGIASEDMAALFGEFNRINPSGMVSGTGLGLAICKEFTELLGGRIEATSEAGQGTRFAVMFPAVKEGSAGTASAA